MVDLNVLPIFILQFSGSNMNDTVETLLHYSQSQRPGLFWVVFGFNRRATSRKVSRCDVDRYARTRGSQPGDLSSEKTSTYSKSPS